MLHKELIFLEDNYHQIVQKRKDIFERTAPYDGKNEILQQLTYQTNYIGSCIEIAKKKIEFHQSSLQKSMNIINLEEDLDDDIPMNQIQITSEELQEIEDIELNNIDHFTYKNKSPNEVKFYFFLR